MKMKPQIAFTREELLCFSTCITETKRTRACRAQKNPNSPIYDKTTRRVKTVTVLMKMEYGGKGRIAVKHLGSIFISITSMQDSNKKRELKLLSLMIPN